MFTNCSSKQILITLHLRKQCSPIVDQNQNQHSSLPNITVAAHLKVEPPANLEATVGEDSLLRCQVAGNNIFWERIFMHIMQYFLGENIQLFI